jgi:hypothetical protein
VDGWCLFCVGLEEPRASTPSTGERLARCFCTRPGRRAPEQWKCGTAGQQQWQWQADRSVVAERARLPAAYVSAVLTAELK